MRAWLEDSNLRCRFFGSCSRRALNPWGGNLSPGGLARRSNDPCGSAVCPASGGGWVPGFPKCHTATATALVRKTTRAARAAARRYLQPFRRASARAVTGRPASGGSGGGVLSLATVGWVRVVDSRGGREEGQCPPGQGRQVGALAEWLQGLGHFGRGGRAVGRVFGHHPLQEAL